MRFSIVISAAALRQLSASAAPGNRSIIDIPACLNSSSALEGIIAAHPLHANYTGSFNHTPPENPPPPPRPNNGTKESSGQPRVPPERPPNNASMGSPKPPPTGSPRSEPMSSPKPPPPTGSERSESMGSPKPPPTGSPRSEPKSSPKPPPPTGSTRTAPMSSPKPPPPTALPRTETKSSPKPPPPRRLLQSKFELPQGPAILFNLAQDVGLTKDQTNLIFNSLKESSTCAELLAKIEPIFAPASPTV